MSENQYEETDEPRDITIEASKRELYEELQQNEGSPFQGAHLFEIFVFSMSYGSKKVGRVELESGGGRQALFQLSSLGEDEKWIIRSLAVEDEQTTDVLRDKKQVYRIAMELANGGIEELHGKVFGPGDALSELSTEIIEISNS